MEWYMDQYGIVSTYINISKKQACVISITTNTCSVQIWANGHHLCIDVLTKLESLKNNGVDKNKEKRKNT